MRIQYAALNDLESVIKDISKFGKGRVALLYDPKTGWVATDEIVMLPSKEGPGVFEFKARWYGDWLRPHVANAVSALGAVRFLGESAMDKLFRKPLPLPPLSGEAPATGAGVGGKPAATPAAVTPTKQAEGRKGGATQAPAKK